MKSSTDFLPSLPQSFLLIGAPGTGKTTIALQLPKPFILDCDGNLNGPVKFLNAGKRLTQPWFYDTPFTDAKGKPTPRVKLLERCTELLSEAANDPNVETIVIDSLTSFVQFVFIQVLVNQKRPPSEGFNVTISDSAFEQRDWGVFFGLMQRTIFWLKGCGKRIVICAHIKTDKDDMKGTLLNFINVPGQIRDFLSGWFEEAWQVTVETTGVPGTATFKETRKVLTVPDSRSANLGLKTSSGLGTSFNPDDISKLISKTK
jgi:hypothetical protein